DLVADEEPLVDCAEAGEYHQEEGEAVATLILLEGLGTERTEQAADAVRQPVPSADRERSLVDVVDVLLRRRRNLLRGGRLRLGARGCLLGRASGLRGAPGHTQRLWSSTDTAA